MFSGITNHYEYLVFLRIREQTPEAGMGLDEEQLEDVACVALNALPPRYYRYSVDLATHLTQEDHEKLQQDVNQAVENAFNLVRSRRLER
jgi:hypothetical protein